MNEPMESILRNYRSAAPPETLRNDILANLRPRRFRHLQQTALRIAIAVLLLTMFWARLMENQTANRMIAVMCPNATVQTNELGMLAWIIAPKPQLPLSPQAPAVGICLRIAASTDVAEGDPLCAY